MRMDRAEPPSDVPAAEREAGASPLRDLLIFEFGGELYALAAASVDGVVGWKSPTAVPGTDARIRGVIQDRGRVVVVMAHPAGRVMPGDGPVPRRVVVCSIQRGLIGLPASNTLAVGPVAMLLAPSPLSRHESKFGPFTYLDANQYDVSEFGG